MKFNNFFCDRKILLSGIRSLEKKIKNVENRVKNGIENLQYFIYAFLEQESLNLAYVENFGLKLKK